MPKYINIPQKPYCCVPASISMVLLRHNLLTLSQEQVGIELGLTIPPKHQKYFSNKVKVSIEMPSAGYGTQLTSTNDLLNKFFRRYKIPLKENYIFSENQKELVEILN